MVRCTHGHNRPHPPELHRLRGRRPRRGPDRGDPQPRHRRGDRQRAPLDRRGRRPRRQGRPRRVRRRLVDDDPRRARGPLLKLADAIEEHADELAELESDNAGKPIAAFRDDEIPFMVDNLRFFAGAARCLEGRAAGEYMSGYTSIIRREPVGVIGQIAPWNYPLMMAVWKIGPALAAGNTIVLKPAETTPLTTLKLAEFAAEIFPKGVLNVITGHGDPAGQRARHPPRRRHGLADRLGRDRQVDRPQRRGHAQARAPRARRQGAGGRLRRRRHGDRAGDDRRHRLLQRRPGLHGRDARARRRQGLRRRRRRPRRAGRRAS